MLGGGKGVGMVLRLEKTSMRTSKPLWRACRLKVRRWFTENDDSDFGGLVVVEFQ
jgi:hypothetical protein